MEFTKANQGPSRGDARLIGSCGVTQGVHGFSRQCLEFKNLIGVFCDVY